MCMCCSQYYMVPIAVCWSVLECAGVCWSVLECVGVCRCLGCVGVRVFGVIICGLYSSELAVC